MVMKVTVCFGSIRVLVPCGAGDLLVRDLIREATLRYKKATGQGPDTWIGVRALRASSGGILDPDDRVHDVADDRETLTAECTSSAPQPRAAQADGASGSSAGTASPDMFRGGGGVGGSMRVPAPDSCVEVGAADLEDGAAGLQVRRGSEPSLHQDSLPLQMQVSDETKRWSAAVVCRDDLRSIQKVSPLGEGRPPDPSSSHLPPHMHHAHFQRQSNRLSMQFSGQGSGVWLDAAERVQSYGSKSLPRDARREPLGQDTTDRQNNNRVEDMLRWVSGVNNVGSVHPVQEHPLDLLPEVVGERAISVEMPVSPSSKPVMGGTQVVPVTLVKGEKGLGFTITTRDNPTGGHCPIYIKNILPKGAAVADGRLRAGDRLLSVGGASVAGLSQQHVVAALRNTPAGATVALLVDRPAPHPSHAAQRVEPQQNPTKYTEKAVGSLDSILTNQIDNQSHDIVENGRVSNIVKAINNSNGSMRTRINKSSSKDELSKEVTPDSMVQETLNNSTNSVLGLRNRLILRLDVPVHDSEKAGLGISVKGKVTVGPDPQDLGIFIKSVLNGGAASRDGRLHTNDQLLSVNGVSLVGQSNAEAMETLRHALLHARPYRQGNICLTVARRTASTDSLSRWKDDTPPNGNETTTSNENSNSQNFTSTTVIYNNNNNKENNKINMQTDNNYNQVKIQYNNNNKETDKLDSRSGKRHTSIVTINNNNSWLNQSDDSKGYLERDSDNVPRETKRDSFEWSRLDGWNPVIDRLTGLRNESYYMATQTETNGHRDYRPNAGHVHMQRSPPHHNVIIEEDYGTTRGAPYESGSERESEAGGAGGGSGGADAFSRDAVGRRSMSEKRHAALDARATGTYHRIKQIKAANAMQVGPSLGMRKSSSLESLQTAIQENQRNPNKEPTYARVHPPLKHWLTDGHHGPETMVRGSPQQSSLSHKKPSIFKSISTMFRIGKPHKKPDNEIYGRTQPGRSSEKSLSRDAVERHSRIEDRHEEQKQNTQPQQRPVVHHSRQSSSEKSTNSQYSPPYRVPPSSNMAPPPPTKVLDPAWGPTEHYVNYDEIQQNLNARREKLSEVQIGQMRRQVHAQRAKAEEESRRAATGAGGAGGAGGYHSARSCRAAGPRPQSNYYEYETAPARRSGKLSHYH